MMAVTGALIVLSTLPASNAVFSFSLASFVLTKTSRIGQQLALVGPHLHRSKIRSSRLSSTGLSCQKEKLRA